MTEWKNAFDQAGLQVEVIASDKKTAFHRACAAASNLVCALMQDSLSTLMDCGFSAEGARAAIKPLVMANINRVFEVGAVEALTGPMERNDTQTVKKHLLSMDRETERLMYLGCSLKLLEMAKMRHPETAYTEMEDLLRKEIADEDKAHHTYFGKA